MRSRLVGIFGLGLLTMTGAACSGSSEQTAGEGSAHKDGTIVWANDAHGWADLDRASFDASRPNEKSAPASHPASSRLQAWVDRYENVAREIVRATGTELAAPHPYARIVISPDLEPAISTVPVCIASASAPPSPLPATEVPLGIMAGPKTFQPAAAGETCAQARNWTSASGLTWFNKLGGFKVTAGASAVDVKNGTESAGRAARVAVRAVPSFIDVNAGTIVGLSEKGVAVAIAHQMAHYLRTHASTSVDGKYDFWFDRSEHTTDRPKPVADQAQYADQYAKLKLPRFLVPGQKLHPRIAATLIGWLDGATLDAKHVCADAKSTLESFPAAIHDELVGGDAPLSFDARQAFLSFDSKLGPCIDAVALTDVAEPTDGTTLTFEGSSMSRAWLAKRIEAPIAAEVAQADIDATRTLADLVGLLDAAGKKLDDEAPEFLKHLADNDIGRYTAEQEADELSMELATKIGLTTDEVMAGYIELMYAEEKADPQTFVARQGMTAKACEDLAKAGFKDADRDVYVSLGALEDPHHAFCYRLFDLDRERQAHAYPVVTPKFPATKVAWKDIQDAANVLLHPDATPVQTTPSDPGTTTTPPTDDTPPPSGGATEDPLPSGAAQDTTGDEPVGEPSVDDAPAAKPKASAGGCSTAPGSSPTEHAWLLGVAAALAFTRRRRAAA